MGPFGVVEVDPLADDPFGLEAVRLDTRPDPSVPVLARAWRLPLHVPDGVDDPQPH